MCPIVFSIFLLSYILCVMKGTVFLMLSLKLDHSTSILCDVLKMASRYDVVNLKEIACCTVFLCGLTGEVFNDSSS